MTWSDRASRFRDLHRSASPFLLPSVERVFSVSQLEALGFQAAEVSTAHVEDLLPCTAANADARAAVDTGCVGVRFHDSPAQIEAAARAFPDLLITASTSLGDSLDAALERLRRYHEAGADVVEVLGLRRAEDIARVASVGAWVNVTLGLGGIPPSLALLGELGVTRVSTGDVLDRLGSEAATRAAREMLDHGTFEFLVEL